MKKIFLLATIMLLAYFSLAQVDLDPAFSAKLDAMQLEFLEPVEGRYKDRRVVSNPYQDYDFMIRSRREKLEIRYLLEPWKANDRSFQAPHVRATRLLLHLATNDQDAVITGLDLTEEALQQFNADWGKVFFFHPKPGFSEAPNCKMLALFREGRGIAYVFFLFDKPGPELDHRFLALQFREELDR